MTELYPSSPGPIAVIGFIRNRAERNERFNNRVHQNVHYSAVLLTL